MLVFKMSGFYLQNRVFGKLTLLMNFTPPPNTKGVEFLKKLFVKMSKNNPISLCKKFQGCAQINWAPKCIHLHFGIKLFKPCLLQDLGSWENL